MLSVLWMKAGLFFSCTRIPLQKKTEEFLSQSFEEMQVHKVLRKKLLPYFQLPCKKTSCNSSSKVDLCDMH